MNRTILAAALAFLSAPAFLRASPPSAAQPLASVPYRTEGKFIMLPVTLGSAEPVWFAFDSASEHSVIDSRFAALNHLEVRNGGSVRGTVGLQVPIGHVGPQNLRIGRFRWRAEDPWIIDLSDLSIQGTSGFVGGDLLRRFVVRIDPDRRVFEIFDPAGYRPPHDEVSLPLIARDGKLYVDATLVVRPDLVVRHRLRVDTGSEDSVNDPIVGQAAETRGTPLGGLGGSVDGVSGVYEEVRLGPYSFRHVWGPGGPDPAIGMELLRRFTITFDVPHGRVYLRPGRAINEPVPAPD